jgi:CelD/BcsL family acetyltransferase involved in cellulose biosynthesis
MIITVRRGGQLIGLAPLLIYPNDGQRVLAFMAGGVSDYLDALVHPDYADVIIRCVWDEIHRAAEKWDRVDFTDLPGNSEILKFNYSGAEVSEHDVCPVIGLANAHSPRDVVPARQLRNVRNARARMDRLGEGRVEIARKQNIESLLAAMIRLHEHRWAEESGGVLGDERVQRFHRLVAPLLLDKGVLRLYASVLNGRVIATLYAFAESEVVYCYLQGFDPEFKSVSPGTQIVSAVIQDAIQNGKRQINFLRGREGYKYAWGATDQSTYRVQLCSEEALASHKSEVHAGRL